MTNGERNTALYQKMFAEQETFRDWLKSQPPVAGISQSFGRTDQRSDGIPQPSGRRFQGF